jgi:hypothetical protein
MSQRADFLLNGATAAPAVGVALQPSGDTRAYQARVTGTGALTATVEIYGSNFDPSAQGVGNAGLLMGTITLSGNTDVTDGFTAITPWRYTWAKLTAISGTNATCDVRIGVGSGLL